MGESDAPCPVFGVGAADPGDGGRDFLLFADFGGTVTRQERMIKMLQKALFGQKSEKIIDTDERQGVRVFIEQVVSS